MDRERVLRDAYVRLRGAFQRAAQRIVGDADAEDLVQEVMLESWRKRERLSENRGSVDSWLFTMLRSRGIDRLRARARWVALGAKMPRSLPESSERPLLDLELHRALERVPAPARRVLRLYYLEGMSEREISALASLPIGTVKSRKHGGLRQMRKLYSE